MTTYPMSLRIYCSCLRIAERMALALHFLLLGRRRWAFRARLRYIRSFFRPVCSHSSSTVFSAFSRTWLSRLMSWGYAMSAGQQMASRISVPLLGGSFPSSESSVCSVSGFGMEASRMAARSSSLNRFRNATSVDAPNGHDPYSFMPMKYCRYGFSPICFTSHLSLQFSRRWINSAPNAIRTGWAGRPLLTNWAAYRSSAVSDGTSADSFTQSFSGSNFPYGNIKSSIRSWLLPLYIRSDSPCASFFSVSWPFPCTYYIVNTLEKHQRGHRQRKGHWKEQNGGHA